MNESLGLSDTAILGCLCFAFLISSLIGWVEVYARREISKVDDLVIESQRKEIEVLRGRLEGLRGNRDYDSADWWKQNPEN